MIAVQCVGEHADQLGELAGEVPVVAAGKDRRPVRRDAVAVANPSILVS